MSSRTAHRLIDDYHLLSYDEVDSTNDEARRLAEGGASHGAFIWARRQTAGRGRMQREWISDEGNLFVSILLQPELPHDRLSELSFVMALAAYDTLQPIIGEDHTLELKWPNDVLLDGHKVGGVLLESFSLEGGKPWVVAGLGVNIEHYPQDVLFPATCLMEAGVQIVSAKIVLSRFIHHFIQRYDAWVEAGFAPVLSEWRKHAWRIGSEIRIHDEQGEVCGRFEDVDDQGRLSLTLPDGDRRLINAGDVMALRQLEQG